MQQQGGDSMMLFSCPVNIIYNGVVFMEPAPIQNTYVIKHVNQYGPPKIVPITNQEQTNNHNDTIILNNQQHTLTSGGRAATEETHHVKQDINLTQIEPKIELLKHTQTIIPGNTDVTQTSNPVFHSGNVLNIKPSVDKHELLYQHQPALAHSNLKRPVPLEFQIQNPPSKANVSKKYQNRIEAMPKVMNTTVEVDNVYHKQNIEKKRAKLLTRMNLQESNQTTLQKSSVTVKEMLDCKDYEKILSVLKCSKLPPWLQNKHKSDNIDKGYVNISSLDSNVNVNLGKPSIGGQETQCQIDFIQNTPVLNRNNQNENVESKQNVPQTRESEFKGRILMNAPDDRFIPKASNCDLLRNLLCSSVRQVNMMKSNCDNDSLNNMKKIINDLPISNIETDFKHKNIDKKVENLKVNLSDIKSHTGLELKMQSISLKDVKNIQSNFSEFNNTHVSDEAQEESNNIALCDPNKQTKEITANEALIEEPNSIDNNAMHAELSDSVYESCKTESNNETPEVIQSLTETIEFVANENSSNNTKQIHSNYDVMDVEIDKLNVNLTQEIESAVRDIKPVETNTESHNENQTISKGRNRRDTKKKQRHLKSRTGKRAADELNKVKCDNDTVCNVEDRNNNSFDILTHIVEGIVIQESNKPFPVRRISRCVTSPRREASNDISRVFGSDEVTIETLMSWTKETLQDRLMSSKAHCSCVDVLLAQEVDGRALVLAETRQMLEVGLHNECAINIARAVVALRRKQLRRC